MDGRPFFMKVMGLDDKCNDIMSDAIDIAQTSKCENVNTAHVFIAIIKDTQFGEIFEHSSNYNYNSVMTNFRQLVDNGDFGHSDLDVMQSVTHGRMNFLSQNLAKILAELTAEAFTRGEVADYNTLMEKILEDQEEYLVLLLDYMDLTVSDISDMMRSSCVIPDSLEDYVKDLTLSERILESTYVNTDVYTDEIVEVLGRRKKPNPLLIGDPGVGKTAVAEAFAQRLANMEVPDFLQGYHICSVDGSVLTAGTRYRGDFEARVKNLLSFAEKQNVILFIDEFHSFVEAGSGSQGAETAGNMLKAKMNEGTIKVIGATTRREFKRFIEKDEAICRRMETIEVKEPSIKDAVDIVCDSIVDYEQFHNVHIPDSSVELAAKLSNRYMKDKHFPDKIFTIIDHASSHAKVGQSVMVSSDLIEETVSKLTGIPVDKLEGTDTKKLIALEDTLSQKIIGQPEAVSTVARAVRRGKAGISDPNRPLASFLFVGPTGVGKTELCKRLSEEVAIGDMPLIRVDMSEFSDKISVNKMIGSAPGYVGYGEGGQLTEKIKHNPCSLILFDEIEKAHPDVFDIFLQILDDGRLSDSDGQTVDFTNCIIVMTSNAWISKTKRLGFGSEQNKDEERRESERKALEDLEKTFKPEFLNRIDNIVLFNKLTEEQCEDITKLLLDKLKERVLSEKKISLTFSDNLVTYITHKGYSDKYGARNIRREIQNTVEDAVALKLLYGELEENTTVQVNLDESNEIILEAAV